MRKDILEAAIRVLRKEGALRFTTPRVAAVAGISVGSLYQYFPNKQALIFALHSRAVDRAWSEVQSILGDPALRPRQQLRAVAEMFFVAESEDVADMGAALQDAEIYFEGRPEVQELERRVLRRFTAFVAEVRPRLSHAEAAFGADLMVTVLEQVGKTVAARKLEKPAVRRWAHACADMLAGHLEMGS
jgi:AcrR family transcriptional regulator